MRTSRENRVGWIGSLIFHALLLFIFFLVKIPEVLQREDVVELSWGAATSVVRAAPSSMPARGEVTEISASRPLRLLTPSQTVIPPERRIPDLTDEVLRIPRTEKLTSVEPSLGAQRAQSASVGERDQTGRRTLGEKETDLSGGLGDRAGTVTPSAGLTGAGSGIDQGISFNIHWLDGGTRRKISGDLPKYPEGVNVEAQIRIEAVITPEGMVKSLHPMQKGNMRLEEAAIKEVRHWRFERLKASQPQVDQTCQITFLFTLK